MNVRIQNTTTLHYDFNKRLCTSTVHGIKILPTRNIHFNQKTFPTVAASFSPVCMPSLVLGRKSSMLTENRSVSFRVKPNPFKGEKNNDTLKK